MVIPINSAQAVETACCRRNLIYCADVGVVNKLRSIAEHNIPKEAITSYFQGQLFLSYKSYESQYFAFQISNYTLQRAGKLP